MTNSGDQHFGGPPGSSKPIGGIRGPTGSDATKPATGPDSVDAAGEIDETTQVQQTAAVGEIANSAAVDAIASEVAVDLANGAIGPSEARARLIDAIVQAQLPADVDPAIASALRADVETLLAGDPMLEGLLKLPTS